MLVIPIKVYTLYASAPKHKEAIVNPNRRCFILENKGRAPTPALATQLELLGSPPDSVGCFAMREGPSPAIVGYSGLVLPTTGQKSAIVCAIHSRYRCFYAHHANWVAE